MLILRNIGLRAAISFLTAFLLFSGCAALFGWDIHAPGILSESFVQNVQPSPHRVAFYLDPESWKAVSKNKGGFWADPQTYHVGEAFLPMVIEGFQNGFEEFVFLEVEPSAAILQQYGIEYAAMTKIMGLGNSVTLKGQALELRTRTAVYDTQMQLLGEFESRGLSDAKKVFAKKGGPEVNLNAAIENNILAMVQYIQDAIRTGDWRQ